MMVQSWAERIFEMNLAAKKSKKEQQIKLEKAAAAARFEGSLQVKTEIIMLIN